MLGLPPDFNNASHEHRFVGGLRVCKVCRLLETDWMRIAARLIRYVRPDRSLAPGNYVAEIEEVEIVRPGVLRIRVRPFQRLYRGSRV